MLSGPQGSLWAGAHCMCEFSREPTAADSVIKIYQGRVGAGMRMVKNSLRQFDLDAKLEAQVMDLKGRGDLVGGMTKC